MKKLLIIICLLWCVISFGCDEKQSSSKYPNPNTQSGYTNKNQHSKQQTPKEVTVYITRTGQNYHRIGWRYLSKSCIPIDLNNATKSRGYTPCSVCAPPIGLLPSQSDIRTAQKETDSNNIKTTPPIAENGSYYGEISKTTGRPKDVYVKGYYRKDGTYVRGHYRSRPRRR